MTPLSERLAVATQCTMELREQYEHARTQTSIARNTEVSALNALNEAQRACDALIAELKKDAPRESDWRTADRARDAQPCEPGGPR